MIIWTQDESKFVDIYGDKLITKDLNVTHSSQNLVYDLTDFSLMEIIETIDFLKEIDSSHILVSFDLDILRSINSIYLSMVKNNDIRKVCYFSVLYKGSDIIECARVLNIDCVYNILVEFDDKKDYELLHKIKKDGKSIISSKKEYIYCLDGLLL